MNLENLFWVLVWAVIVAGCVVTWWYILDVVIRWALGWHA